MRLFIKDVDGPSPYLANIQVALTTGTGGSKPMLVGYPLLLPHEVTHWAVGPGKVHLNAVLDILGRNHDMLNCMTSDFCTQVNFRPQSTRLMGCHGNEVDQH